MNLKKSFKIKGHDWTLDYKWGLRQGDQVINGLTDQETRTITIRRELSKDEKLEVFIHEFIHAALFEMHLSGPADRLTEDVEEVICTGLSDVLLNTFNFRWKRQS